MFLISLEYYKYPPKITNQSVIDEFHAKQNLVTNNVNTTFNQLFNKTIQSPDNTQIAVFIDRTLILYGKYQNKTVELSKDISAVYMGIKFLAIAYQTTASKSYEIEVYDF